MAVGAQLVLIVGLLFVFRLQSEAFRRIVILSAAAFPVHHYLPHRFRLPLFAALSLASIFVVADAASALWIVGLGGALIGLCHLPVAHSRRVALVAASGALLAAARAGWVPVPWSAVVFPLLGSMFMFRVIAYLYDLKDGSQRPDLWRALSYFFMMPNVCFPLFPVVDYKTFVRTHYDRDAIETYQVGLRWMLRGAVQLILYRAVYLYAVIDPAQVDSGTSLARYIVATYLLYLNISGMFHMIAGLLHMYGFGLPETHHRYLLASSFTDFWRRINVYWKDFIMKIVFYPTFFRLRRIGQTRALVVATFTAFFATWVLHSYQFFWLRGSVLFTVPDATFWAILGVLVCVNTLLEARATPRRGKATSRAREAGLVAARTVGTFVTLSVLWSLWTSSSLDEWVTVMRHGLRLRPSDLLAIAGGIGAVAISAVLFGGERERKALGRVPGGVRAFWRSVAWTTAAAVVLLTCAFGPAQRQMPSGVRSVLASIERSDQLNRQDLAALQRGYYEDLTQVHRFSQELSVLYGERPPDYFADWKRNLNRSTGTYLLNEIAGSATYEYLRVRYTTNRWGMRDREYAKEKPSGTYRMAMLGASTALGWGVGDGETFEALTEQRLNDTGTQAKNGTARWELLNFSVNGYDPVRKLLLLEQRVFDFQPDAVVQLADANDMLTVVANLIYALQHDVDLPYDFLQDVVRRAGVDRRGDEAAMRVRLMPFAAEVTEWALRRFATLSRERGVESYWVYIPDTTGWYAEQMPTLFEIAGRAGFTRIIDLRPAFEGQSLPDLRLFPWDLHPNVRAHRLLAERFMASLAATDEARAQAPGR